jgi:hypothetical protein
MMVSAVKFPFGNVCQAADGVMYLALVLPQCPHFVESIEDVTQNSVSVVHNVHATSAPDIPPINYVSFQFLTNFSNLLGMLSRDRSFIHIVKHLEGMQ